MMFGFIKISLPILRKVTKNSGGGMGSGGWRAGIKGLDSKHRKSILSRVLFKSSTLVKFVNFWQYEAK